MNLPEILRFGAMACIRVKNMLAVDIAAKCLFDGCAALFYAGQLFERIEDTAIACLSASTQCGRIYDVSGAIMNRTDRPYDAR